jgi:drug/metabolite transporter (DMT)-like permease
MNEILGILILIASVLFGGALVTILQKVDRGQMIKLLLSLSGGFLLAIAFVHFIPEIYVHNGEQIGYYILLGFFSPSQTARTRSGKYHSDHFSIIIEPTNHIGCILYRIILFFYCDLIDL